jgi:hypothetical protein
LAQAVLDQLALAADLTETILFLVLLLQLAEEKAAITIPTKQMVDLAVVVERVRQFNRELLGKVMLVELPKTY